MHGRELENIITAVGLWYHELNNICKGFFLNLPKHFAKIINDNISKP